MGFFIETIIAGLMSGVLYALIALGFVLIYKASGVFNFAQGAMVLFAALAMARLQEHMPWPLAFLLAFAIMVVLAWLIERLVLRHLINQEGVTLLMATLGVAYFLEGLGQMVWGDDIYPIDLGMPKQPTIMLQSLIPGGILVSNEDLIAAVRQRPWLLCSPCSSRNRALVGHCVPSPTTTKQRSPSASRCHACG
jgi:amino acid/amide ABC transporter membrane protein 1, HAAT family (TC 3.A.1.4.-)